VNMHEDAIRVAQFNNPVVLRGGAPQSGSGDRFPRPGWGSRRGWRKSNIAVAPTVL
jgi:hypothetical protein